LMLLVYVSTIPRSDDRFAVDPAVYDNIMDDTFWFSRSSIDIGLSKHYDSIMWATVKDRPPRYADAMEYMLHEPSQFSGPKEWYGLAVVRADAPFYSEACPEVAGVLEFSVDDAKRLCHAEFDALCELQDWPLHNASVDSGQLEQPFFSVTDCPGFVFAREISNTSKTWDDINKKLKALLPSNYRPLHVLRIFAGFDIICRSLPLGVQTAASLGKACIRYHVPLAILTFAGRVCSVHVDDFLAKFPPKAFLDRHTNTMMEAYEENRELRRKLELQGFELSQLTGEKRKRETN
jgi:hypothetical protein